MLTVRTSRRPCRQGWTVLSFLSHMPIIKPNSFPKHTPALHTTYNWAALSEGKTRGRGPGVPVTWGPRAGAGRLAAKANVSLGRAPTWTPGGCLPQSLPPPITADSGTRGLERWEAAEGAAPVTIPHLCHPLPRASAPRGHPAEKPLYSGKRGVAERPAARGAGSVLAPGACS